MNVAPSKAEHQIPRKFTQKHDQDGVVKPVTRHANIGNEDCIRKNDCLEVTMVMTVHHGNLVIEWRDFLGRLFNQVGEAKDVNIKKVTKCLHLLG